MAELAPWIPRAPTWKLGCGSRAPRIELQPLRELIVKHLKRAGPAGLTHEELVDRTEADPTEVSKALQALRKTERIESIGRRCYRALP